MVFVLRSSPNHTPIKYRALIKKSIRITTAHLMLSSGNRFNESRWHKPQIFRTLEWWRCTSVRVIGVSNFQTAVDCAILSGTLIHMHGWVQTSVLTIVLGMQTSTASWRSGCSKTGRSGRTSTSTTTRCSKHAKTCDNILLVNYDTM